jgi:transcriptional regulator with XRE-family HTH domain
MLDAVKARHLGILLPDQLRAMRKAIGLTQKKMAELLQLGEKTWTRWETGAERPSRSMNVLLCALHEGKIDVGYLVAAEKPCFGRQGHQAAFGSGVGTNRNALSNRRKRRARPFINFLKL